MAVRARSPGGLAPLAPVMLLPGSVCGERPATELPPPPPLPEGEAPIREAPPSGERPRTAASLSCTSEAPSASSGSGVGGIGASLCPYRRCSCNT